MDADKSIKRVRNNLMISSIILCIAGLIFMIFSETMVKMFGWILGSILCVIGIIYLVGYIKTKMEVSDLIIGILSIVFGILIFAHPAWIMSMLTVIIGIYILVEGALKIKISIDAKKQAAKGWWVLLVTAIISVVVGILLICNPFGTSKAFMFVLGLGLLLNGIEDIIHAVYTKKIAGDMSSEVIDMDEYIERNKE